MHGFVETKEKHGVARVEYEQYIVIRRTTERSSFTLMFLNIAAT